MRSFRHLTPLYVWNRLASMAWSKANPDHPWLTREMVDILCTWLKPTDVGLEFGSGRSTAWFATRVGSLTSVEHDSQWFATVRKRLCDIDRQVQCLLHEDGNSGSPASAYVSVARSVAPSSLDFCLIDGVARDHCALACLDKLKPGGILIIDNVNWFIPRLKPSSAPNSRTLQHGFATETWRLVGEAIADWRSVWTSDGVTDTAFWVRPYK